MSGQVIVATTPRGGIGMALPFLIHISQKRNSNATPHAPNMVSYSGVGIALCESTVVREYRC